MIKNSLRTRLKGSRGITLIALVISVIVLLILAGVSISAITGNESAMEKAKQAKVKNEAADELDTIKLAVVDAVAHGNDGYVSGPNLADALDGIISSDQISTIRANVNGPTWVVTGNKGKYEISRNGQVEALSGIELSQTEITFTEGATNADVQLTATLTADLMGSTVTWSSSNENVATVNENGKVSLATNMQEDDKNTAIITAEIEGTTNVAKCTVTFVETQIHSIEVSLSSNTVRIGNTVTATTTGKGILGKDFGTITTGVTYSSDDTSVTVSGATITGEAVGQATITATYSGITPSVTATCDIEVENPPVELATQSSIAGTYIDLGIDLDDDGTTTNDWKIVYNDTDNNVIYAMTDKYLKVGKVPTGINLSTSGTFGVYSNGRNNLINGLKNATAWRSLISSNILTAYPSIEVYGALEKGSSTTPKTIEYLREKTASYYLPSNKDSMDGYWLASLKTDDPYAVYYVKKNGSMYQCYYGYEGIGVCPAVVLPSNIQVTSTTVGTKTVWNVVTDAN